MSTPPDPRAEFLRALPAQDYLPPPEAVAALNARASTAVPDGTPAGEPDPHERQRLRDDVEAFAAAYWALPPAERLAKWTELMGRVWGGCDDDAATRLRHLKAGLEVEATAHEDEQVRELAELIRELYTLPPRERAVRRNGWLVGPAEGRHEWKPWTLALRSLRAANPALANLEPVLHERVADLRSFLHWANPRTGGTGLQTSIRPTEARQPAYANGSGGQPAASSQRGAFSGLWIFIVLGIIVVRVLAAMVGSSGSPSPPASSPSRYYTPPGQQPPKVEVGFTREQIQRCREYEADRTKPQPLEYPGWVLAGRPVLPGVPPVEWRLPLGTGKGGRP